MSDRVETTVSIVAVKTPKTYEQQAALISSKGFRIDDRTACIEFLKQANYYRLSAYFLPFRKKTVHTPGVITRKYSNQKYRCVSKRISILRL